MEDPYRPQSRKVRDPLHGLEATFTPSFPEDLLVQTQSAVVLLSATSVMMPRGAIDCPLGSSTHSHARWVCRRFWPLLHKSLKFDVRRATQKCADHFAQEADGRPWRVAYSWRSAHFRVSLEAMLHVGCGLGAKSRSADVILLVELGPGTWYCGDLWMLHVQRRRGQGHVSEGEARDIMA